MLKAWPVVDLFSGAGGMSCGFQRHPGFRVVGAVDAQIGKPSAAPGSLGCNASYAASIGIEPVLADLAVREPADVCAALGPGSQRPAVLTACPPCTGFSRAMAGNHLRDDRRNSLVERVADYVALLRAGCRADRERPRARDGPVRRAPAAAGRAAGPARLPGHGRDLLPQ